MTMSHNHTFPSRDGDFDNYANSKYAYLKANEARLGINSAGILAILGPPPTPAGPPPGTNATPGTWNYVYPLESNPETFTHPLKLQKDSLRAQLETAFRTVYGDIPQSVLTADDRTALNLPERDTVPTPVGVKDNAPIVSFEPSVHTLQTIRFGNPDDPQTQAMPQGQKIMLERFVGEKGLDPATINFGSAQVVTRFLQKVQYTETDVGKTAYLRACYVNTRGEKGPYSAVVSSVII